MDGPGHRGTRRVRAVERPARARAGGGRHGARAARADRRARASVPRPGGCGRRSRRGRPGGTGARHRRRRGRGRGRPPGRDDLRARPRSTAPGCRLGGAGSCCRRRGGARPRARRDDRGHLAADDRAVGRSRQRVHGGLRPLAACRGDPRARGPRGDVPATLSRAHADAVALGAMPLLAEVDGLARRARIALDVPPPDPALRSPGSPGSRGRRGRRDPSRPRPTGSV